MKVAGYIRVSTQEQVEKGWNLDEDRRLIRERCPEGAELELFDDGGLQGDDPNRPGLLALLSRLDEFDLVLMRQQDRISRDPVIWGTAASAFQRAGVRVETFSGPIDLDTPQGRFVADMMAAVGKLEKGQIGQRVKQSLAARAKAGLLSGGPRPFGYRWSGGGLVQVPAEAVIVRRIFEQTVAGVSQRALARSLNAEGAPTVSGRPWTQSTTGNLLGNPLYKGSVRHDGREYPGKHEPIVTPELWDRAEAVRTSRVRRKGGRWPKGSHLLTGGLLKCSCGHALMPRTEPGVYEVYYCRGRHEHGVEFCSQTPIRRQTIDEAVLKELTTRWVDLDETRRRIEARYESDVTVARQAETDADSNCFHLETRLVEIERDYIDGKITAEEWRDLKVKLADALEAAQEARQRAQERVHAVEAAGALADGEQALLERLAALKRAVAGQVEAAPDLNALRLLLRDLFSEIRYCNGVLMPMARVERLADGCWDFEGATRKRPLSDDDTLVR